MIRLLYLLHAQVLFLEPESDCEENLSPLHQVRRREDALHPTRRICFLDLTWMLWEVMTT